MYCKEIYPDVTQMNAVKDRTSRALIVLHAVRVLDKYQCKSTKMYFLILLTLLLLLIFLYISLLAPNHVSALSKA